ncbi:MAG: hypothetical protein AAGI01_01230 [Myxococcota bacterium]
MDQSEVSDMLQEALAPGVRLHEFMFTWVERLHAARLEEYRALTDERLLVHLSFEDSGELYTVALSPGAVEVEGDEMMDFPVISVHAEAEKWETFKPDILELSLALESTREHFKRRAGGRRVTRDILERFEKMAGTMEITVTGTQSGEELTLVVALNDYVVQRDAPRMTMRMDKELVLRMARGELDPKEARELIEIGGKVRLGVDLAGFFAQHF